MMEQHPKWRTRKIYLIGRKSWRYFSSENHPGNMSIFNHILIFGLFSHSYSSEKSINHTAIYQQDDKKAMRQLDLNVIGFGFRGDSMNSLWTGKVRLVKKSFQQQILKNGEWVIDQWRHRDKYENNCQWSCISTQLRVLVKFIKSCLLFLFFS